MMDMQSWAAQLVKAIPLRHSVRAYLPNPLSDDVTKKVVDFADALVLPFEHNVKIKPFKAESGKKLYNNGINPIDNLALIAQTDLVSISKAGFIGELVMLNAVKLGLSTCWFGHYKLSELGRYIDSIAGTERIKESTLGYGYGKHVNVGERAICCMPFGQKNGATKRLVDVVAGKRGANRKPLENLMEQPALVNDLPPLVKDVLELAKLAPSAANSQMWRFGVSDEYRTLTIAKPVGYKHFKWEHPDVDVGMCAAHAWLGLLERGYTPSIEVYQDADRAFWRFNL